MDYKIDMLSLSDGTNAKINYKGKNQEVSLLCQIHGDDVILLSTNIGTIAGNISPDINLVGKLKIIKQNNTVMIAKIDESINDSDLDDFVYNLNVVLNADFKKYTFLY